MGRDLNQLIEIDAPATQAWLYGTLVAIVENGGAVFISTEVLLEVVTLTVKMDADDLGKVIGKQGRTARALRTLLVARGGKDGVRYVLDIQDRAEDRHGRLA